MEWTKDTHCQWLEGIPAKCFRACEKEEDRSRARPELMLTLLQYTDTVHWYGGPCKNPFRAPSNDCPCCMHAYALCWALSNVLNSDDIPRSSYLHSCIQYSKTSRVNHGKIAQKTSPSIRQSASMRSVSSYHRCHYRPHLPVSSTTMLQKHIQCCQTTSTDPSYKVNANFTRIPNVLAGHTSLSSCIQQPAVFRLNGQPTACTWSIWLARAIYPNVIGANTEREARPRLT